MQSKKTMVVMAFAMLIGAALGIIGWQAWQKYRANSLQMMPSTQQAKPESSSAAKAESAVAQDSSGKTVMYWYDPMVPTQKFDKPGKSPFMDMQLIPKYAADHSAASGSNAKQGEMDQENSVTISAQTQQNLGIRIAKAETKNFAEALSAVGRIQPDERRIYVVQTRIPGFVERLLVRAVGDPVVKGQKVAEMYAPELLTAQQEYLALVASQHLSPNMAIASDNLVLGAYARLKLLGMPETEITAITQSGKASRHFGIYAPASGVMTGLNIREGGQLMSGTSLMQITDLSRVWLIADVPERDAASLKLGSLAEIQLQSLPNEVFTGKVDYIYPSLEATTRSLQIRVELANKGGRLRPGMFANVAFRGSVHQTLAVPAEAVISTGTRKVVIVKLTEGFRPVTIQTGQERDGYMEIVKGLSVGDEVVASGQFLIDSEASLSGVLSRFSIDSPEKNAKGVQDNHIEMSNMIETPDAMKGAHP